MGRDRVRTLRAGALAMLLAVLALAPAWPGTARADGRSARVLFLASYHQGDNWTGRIIEAFTSELRKRPGVEVHLEALDVRRRDPAAWLEPFTAYLAAKYPADQVALVACSDDAALDYLLDVRPKLFPGTPVVFCGVNDFTSARLRGQQGITGVTETPDVTGTLELALAVKPEARNLYVVAGNATTTHQANRNRLRRSLEFFRDRLSVTEIVDLDPAQARRVLGGLPKDALVLRLANLVRPDGREASLLESSRIIVESSSAPVFTLWDFDMGYGAVGGRLVSADRQGQVAGELARAVLAGENPGDIRVQDSPNAPTLDWEAMAAFRLDHRAIPGGTRIINRPETFSRTQGLWALAGFAVIVVQAGLIVLLFLSRARRRRAEGDLGRQIRFLETLMDTNPAPIFYKDRSGRYLGCNQAFAAYTGKGKDEIVGRTVGEVWPGPLASLYQTKDDELFRLGGVQVYEGRFRAASGENRDVLFHKAVFSGSVGEVEGILGIMVDITGLKAVERSLAESEEKFRQLVENLREVFWIRNLITGRIEYVSPSYEDVWGLPRQSLLADPSAFMASVLEADRARVEAAYGRLRTQGEEFSEEFRIIRPDGAVRWVWARTIAVRDPDGRISRVLGLAEDVTGRRKADMDLRESEERLRALLDAMPDGVCFKDGQGRWLVANPAMLDIYGLSPSAYRDKTGQELGDLAPIRRQALAACDRSDGEAWRTRSPLVLEEAIAVAPGRERVFETIKVPLFHADGGRRAIIVISRDITQRKAAETALREREERFRRYFELGVVGMAVASTARRLAEVNDRLCAILGYAREELLGRFWDDLVHIEDLPLVSARYQAIMAGGPERDYITVRLARKDGSLVHAVLAGRLVRGEEGRPGHFLILVHDVTDLVRTQESLENARQRAEDASRAKSEFLATMSHEIRTPLNGVLGMLQLVLRSPLAPEIREYVDTAIISARGLLSILNDILDLSRIESGQMELRQEYFSLSETIHAALGFLRTQVRAKGLVAESRMAPDLPELVRGDPGRLRQILFNLLGNAVKFTESGRIFLDVDFAAQPDPGRVALLFTVADTGIGIPEDKLDKVFEPFTQADASNTRRFGGTGLGLTIVRRLVTMMHGHITMDSQVGQGTEVSFSVVLEAGDLPGAGAVFPEPEAPLPPPVPGLSILVAEDDRINQMAIRRLLEQEGHRVRCVSDGQEAVDAVGSEPPDLVLMDIQMPGVDGLEAIRRIRAGLAGEDRRTLPIIALTAYAMRGDRERFLDAGADGYVSKPLDVAELLGVMREALAARRNG